jgi:HAD superfamily 5'-nucleotidase-like hydrolase
MSHKVFCNRTLNMKRINYIGVDMDHTLVRYKSANFEALAHEIMCKKLVENKGYPKSILNLKFQFNRAIRGLVIDKARGNLLKLSRHTAIRQSYHGQTAINYKQQNKIYKSTYIDPKDKGYDRVDTTFSISFAALFAQLVDIKDSSAGHALPEYITIAEDLNYVLDQAHRDGSLKNVVRENLTNFIIKDAELVRGIERYMVHGKKFFIVTNSDVAYAKLLLDYALNPFIKGGRTWRDLFPYVIMNARKPNFFFEDTPFQKADMETGVLTPMHGPLAPGTYSGGNANQFTAELGIEPEEILYIGDHIYGDIVRLKKDCAWRTALVVEELDAEVKSIKKSAPYTKKINELMAQKIPLEVAIDELISKKIETGKETNAKRIETLIKKASETDKKISPLIKKYGNLFNPYWGEVMRAGIEESYFAYQVERFACVYTARLSYLLNDSPRSYFRSSKRALPHEL